MNSAAYSHGWEIISDYGAKTMCEWNCINRKCKQLVLEGHTDDVNSAAYSPDGREIVSASGDKTIKVWNANDSREVRIYRTKMKNGIKNIYIQ